MKRRSLPLTERPALSVLLDQNVSDAIVDWLRAKRPEWRIVHAKNVGLAARPDREVFLWAQENGAIIITFDEDFADPRSSPWGSHHGVVRLRVWPTTVEKTKHALERLLDSVPDDELRGAVVIVGNRRIRVRRATNR